MSRLLHKMQDNKASGEADTKKREPPDEFRICRTAETDARSQEEEAVGR